MHQPGIRSCGAPIRLSHLWDASYVPFMGHDHAPANRELISIAADDLTTASDEELLAAISHAGNSRDTMQVIAGRLIAEARRRALTVREIADRTGIPHSTIHRWAAQKADQ